MVTHARLGHCLTFVELARKGKSAERPIFGIKKNEPSCDSPFLFSPQLLPPISDFRHFGQPIILNVGKEYRCNSEETGYGIEVRRGKPLLATRFLAITS